ncbi:SMODS-associated NUDIX domain-containing protein [Enterococcus faecalis]|uniref:SMODS-associated NUDIX domain-containing protein n=1 Tax=Enterococcus faecalis TaxID=1351 RepID=UPI0037C0212F
MRKYNYKMTVLKMLLLTLISFLFLVGIFMKNSIGSALSNTFFGISIPYCLSSLIDLSDNKSWKNSQRKLKRARLIHKDTKIRISFAYLFRIKVDGKYFLVQNSRTKKYQPVGGAYKLKPKEAQYLSEEIPVENDDRIPIDTTTRGDYRLYVKNKDLRNFIKRFDKTPYRENINNLSREFDEELFSTNILDKETFGDLSYKYCGRHIADVQYSNYFDCYELLLADIVEVILNDEQEQLFRDLMEKSDKRYMFAAFSEVNAGGVMYGTNDLKDKIANHTSKILNENSDKLINKKTYKDEITVNFD